MPVIACSFNGFALPGSRPGGPAGASRLTAGHAGKREPAPVAWRTVMAGLAKEHRVVIVGAGFAGFNAARELSRLVGATTEIVVINSTDYFLYLPLMPQVAGGLVGPWHIRVSLPRRLRKMRFVLGTVNRVDHRQQAVSGTGPEGASGQVGYDRLILTLDRV